ARGNADNDVRRGGAGCGDELGGALRGLGRLALRVPRVDMDDRCAGVAAAANILAYFFRRERYVWGIGPGRNHPSRRKVDDQLAHRPSIGLAGKPMTVTSAGTSLTTTAPAP